MMPNVFSENSVPALLEPPIHQGQLQQLFLTATQTCSTRAPDEKMGLPGMSVDRG